MTAALSNHPSSFQTHPSQRPKSPTRVLAEAEAQWLFTEAELANTPSIKDGLSVSEERELRTKGIHFIVQVGIMLKLPQLTLSTAAIFFHRFLMRASLKREHTTPSLTIPKLHHYQAAATALFLATKVEESGRKMKELILAFCRVAQKNPTLLVDEQNKDWWRWRDCILHHEDLFLETLCFDLTIDSPHRALFDLLKLYAVEHHKRLRNAAWAFVTDGHNSLLCLLCTSRTIAVAGLYAACRACEVRLPDDAAGRPWWEAQGVGLKDVRRAVEYMGANYETAAKRIPGAAGATEDGGERSSYTGLATPVDGEGDGWDSTRAGGAAPEVGGTREGGRRGTRSPTSSAAGEKREREIDRQDEVKVDRANGTAKVNGVLHREDYKEAKRARLLSPADIRQEAVNGTKINEQNPPDARDAEVDRGRELEHVEEALRVEDGNRAAEALVEAADGSAVQRESKVTGQADVKDEARVESRPDTKPKTKAKVESTGESESRGRTKGADEGGPQDPSKIQGKGTSEVEDEGSEEGEVEE